MSTPMFTIGASNSEDKMDMSLDQIISQTKSNKPRRERLTTSPNKKGSLRKREMANKAVKRATQRRTGGVQNMRGIQPTASVTINTPKVRKAPRAAPVDSDWLSQQRQRQAASRQRLQQYSKKVNPSANGSNDSSGPSFTVKLSSANTFNSSNRPGFHFDAPPTFLNSGNNNRNTNNRLNRQRTDVKNITINVSNDRSNAPQRSRQINQQRQSVAVNALRGVTNTTDNRPSTLNDRFGTSKKPNNVRQNTGRTITFNGGSNNRRGNNDNRRGGNSGGGRSVLFG